jgi:hypothetical protein
MQKPECREPSKKNWAECREPSKKTGENFPLVKKLGKKQGFLAQLFTQFF